MQFQNYGFGQFSASTVAHIGSFGMAPAVLKEKKDDSSPESSQGSDEGDEKRMRTVYKI